MPEVGGVVAELVATMRLRLLQLYLSQSQSVASLRWDTPLASPVEELLEVEAVLLATARLRRGAPASCADGGLTKAPFVGPKD